MRINDIHARFAALISHLSLFPFSSFFEHPRPCPSSWPPLLFLVAVIVVIILEVVRSCSYLIIIEPCPGELAPAVAAVHVALWVWDLPLPRRCGNRGGCCVCSLFSEYAVCGRVL